jgi:hypothetical protein
MASGYQLAARRKYRWATILSDGPHGAVSFCNPVEKRVALFATEAEAQRAAAGKCRFVACKGDHHVETFAPVPVPRYVERGINFYD